MARKNRAEAILGRLSKTKKPGKKILFKPEDKKELLKLNEEFLAMRKEFAHDTVAQIELDADNSKRQQLERFINLRIKIADSLTSAQMDFVNHYLKDHDAVGAAQRAGLSKNYWADKIPQVQDYIRVTQKINELTTGITQDFVIGEFLKLAKVSVKGLYGQDGELLPPNELPDDVAAAVSEIKVKTWIENEKPVTETTYKLHSKLVALDALAKHTGMYEKDNRQKAPIVAQQFIIPHNGRNHDLIDNSNITIIDENNPQKNER